MRKLKLKKSRFMIIPLVVTVVAFILLFTVIFNQVGAVKVFAQDLMKEITPQKVETVELKEAFINSTADFSIDLFKQSCSKDKNSLLSPTSVYLALGMTANGAAGNTLKEFETLLGKYNIKINDLNAYYNSLSKKLNKVDSGKLSIANSIWYKQGFDVKKDFLQTNANYYNASTFTADFSDPKTVKDINDWVKLNTGNTIDKIIDKIDDYTVMYLINAVCFEDQWKEGYTKDDIKKDTFQLTNGTKQSVDLMHSEEEWYLKDDKAEGFIKPYKNGKYSFVALLPKENVTIDSYIASLSGESFIRLLKNKSSESVNAAIPKFKAEYEINLVKPLKKMGLKECFSDKANFAKMDNKTRTLDVYVGDVLHKTFITVDAEGTKAGAATKVEMKDRCSSNLSHSIILNRPFVYAIIDNETNLPLFIGTMMKPQ